MKNKLIHTSTKHAKFAFLAMLLFLEFFLAFIICYISIALTTMSISVGENLNKDENVTIFMKTDGIHTDFVFPVTDASIDWRRVFSPEDTKGKNSKLEYISVGWGDQGFFLNTPEWSDLKVSTAVKACFYMSKSAVHINYMKDLGQVKANYVQFKISKLKYHRLYRFVLKTLKRNSMQQAECIAGRGYWETDAFYEAKGVYGLFNTCNSWINKGLKSADLPACFWAPFNNGIYHKYASENNCISFSK